MVAYASFQSSNIAFPENLINVPIKYSAAFVAALALLPLAAAPGSAAAQEYKRQQPGSNAATPHIEGFNVDEVRNLVPGTELKFDMYGSPGGAASLRIVGAQRNLNLVEEAPGEYTGIYTIGSRDRITADSAVTGNLRVGNQVATSLLSESLQRGVKGKSAKNNQAAAPQITRFDVQPAADVSRGSELAFNLQGTPGGKVDVRIAGAQGSFFLDETRSGEYSGIYTIRRNDHIMPSSTVVANLRVDQRVSSYTLRQPLVTATARPVEHANKYCGNCGTVESVNIVEVIGDAGYLGTIGGGLAGVLLGSQVGGGNGRTAAQVAGAVGGALAGREVEKRARNTSHFEVLVRLDNGGMQTISTPADPGLRNGEKVRIVDGGLARL
jgi:outer membrane lipoprotein SlyB